MNSIVYNKYKSPPQSKVKHLLTKRGFGEISQLLTTQTAFLTLASFITVQTASCCEIKQASNAASKAQGVYFLSTTANSSKQRMANQTPYEMLHEYGNQPAVVCASHLLGIITSISLEATFLPNNQQWQNVVHSTNVLKNSRKVE